MALKEFIERHKSSPNFNTYSRFYADYGGYVISRQRGECYGAIMEEEDPLVRLLVFQNKPIHDCHAEYCDYILNEGWFAHTFITKDWEKGLAEGFEMNLDNPFVQVYGGMASIREISWPSWYCPKDWEDLGANKELAMALSHSIYNNGNYGQKLYWNTDHSPYNLHSPVEVFLGENPVLDFDKGIKNANEIGSDQSGFIQSCYKSNYEGVSEDRVDELTEKMGKEEFNNWAKKTRRTNNFEYNEEFRKHVYTTAVEKGTL